MMKIDSSNFPKPKSILTPGVNATNVIEQQSNIGADKLASSLSISSLSLRLSTSDTKNGKSFASLSSEGRSQFVIAAIQEVNYELTPSRIGRAAKEIPTPGDSASVDSAKKATAFIESPGSANPFSSLSSEQLSDLYTDSSGTFTLNERRAAYIESARREQEWRVKVAAQAVQEYNESGKLTKFFGEALKHYESLSPLEQSLYPDEYSSDLRAKIDLDFNYFTGTSGKKIDNSVENETEVNNVIQHFLLGRDTFLS